MRDQHVVNVGFSRVELRIFFHQKMIYTAIFFSILALSLEGFRVPLTKSVQKPLEVINVWGHCQDSPFAFPMYASSELKDLEVYIPGDRVNVDCPISGMDQKGERLFWAMAPVSDNRIENGDQLESDLEQAAIGVRSFFNVVDALKKSRELSDDKESFDKEVVACLDEILQDENVKSEMLKYWEHYNHESFFIEPYAAVQVDFFKEGGSAVWKWLLAERPSQNMQTDHCKVPYDWELSPQSPRSQEIKTDYWDKEKLLHEKLRRPTRQPYHARPSPTSPKKNLVTLYKRNLVAVSVALLESYIMLPVVAAGLISLGFAGVRAEMKVGDESIAYLIAGVVIEYFCFMELRNIWRFKGPIRAVLSFLGAAFGKIRFK